jgi:Tfp pilus assembly protein PilW
MSRRNARWLATLREGGFSLIEVLLGLSLALCLALGLAPVWVSFQSLGVSEGDATEWALQGKVAAARLEKDVRLAGFETCSFSSGATVLQATASQVVLLVSTPGSAAPILVEWELVSGSLMRRWGACPAVRPSTFAHSLYPDSKTMLENVDTAQSGFSYQVAGRDPGTVQAADLPLVDRVSLRLVEREQGLSGATNVVAGAPVGR